CPLFADIPLQQPPAVRKILVACLRNDLLTHAAVGRPGTKALLQPDGQFRPHFPDTQSPIRVSACYFDDGERANHRAVLRFLYVPVFHTDFNVAHAKGTLSRTRRKVLWVVRGRDGHRWNYNMKLGIWKNPPVEFDCRPRCVRLYAGPIGIAKRIKFIVMEVHWFWVVGLKGRACLRLQYTGKK